MELDRSLVVLGAHGVVAAFFLSIAVLGALGGAPLPAVAFRVVLGLLVVGLGVAVARLV